LSEMTVVLVTGGGRGIGAAAARRLAADGHAIAVNYREREEAAAVTVAAIVAAGGKAQAFRADITDEEAVATMFAAVAASFGPITGLVNNAGILGEAARFESIDAAAFERTFAVNVGGTMLCSRAAVRAMSTMRGGAGGTIVNLSSVAARWGGAGGLIPYAASKAAIETLTLGLAREVAGEGIRVNAVAPGLIDTEMNSAERKATIAAEIPIGRVGAATEVAEAVAWLISPAASYVTGATLTVSGGR
jgi:NAD(P)-dependent dehydrogenase (short-subunit alcohol dehydrogenase family)